LRCDTPLQQCAALLCKMLVINRETGRQAAGVLRLQRGSQLWPLRCTCTCTH
jgi:hypothetical protein